MNERMDHQRHIFAQLFTLSNSLQVHLDNMLKDDQLTSKQMLLMIVIGSFGATTPTFKDAAQRSGSSYQNVKQLALKLEKNGYVSIVDDIQDKRAKRLLLTEQAKIYWHNRDDRDLVSIEKLFQTFSLDELAQFDDYIIRLQKAVIGMDEE